MSAIITGNQTGTVGLINTASAKTMTGAANFDFTGLPSGIKRITVSFQNLQTAGSIPMIQLLTGSSTPTTSGYLGTANGLFNGAPGGDNFTSGFYFLYINYSSATIGHGNYRLINITGNIWVIDGIYGSSNTNGVGLLAGSVSLAAACTGIRMTTKNGTDYYTGGTCNILYE